MLELSHIFLPDEKTKSGLPKIRAVTLGIISLLIVGMLSVALGVWIYFREYSSSNSEPLPLVVAPHDSPQSLIVDVSGAVTNPGVYTLSANARIGEAINLAGGFVSQADTIFIHKSINLAQQVHDGEKIYIPFSEDDIDDHDPTQSTQSDLQLISINSASARELEDLPAIGNVTAEKIIANRPFTEINELVIKKIVSEGVLQKISSLISL